KQVNSTTSPDGVGLRIHRLMSQLPLLLHENPQSILLIAFGAGVTAGATLAFDELRTIDCAEISRDVVEAADFFRSWNHDVVHSPRFHLTIEDGRNFVLTAPRTYDVVTAGIINPKNNAGNAGFYNRDFYEVCKTRLNRGGIVCQWAPLYGLTVDEFKMIIATFLDVFPHASLWFAQSYGQMGNSNALLIGSPEAVEWRYSRLRERFAHRGLADDLRGEGIESPVELLDCFVVGERALRDFAGGGTARTTDNHPRLEFGGITMAYDTLLALLADIREPVWPYLVDLRDAAGPERLAVIDSLQRQFEISNYCIRGDIGELAKNYNSALADYGRALAVQPENSDLRAVYRALQVQANNSLLRECLTNTRGQMDVVRSLSQRLQYKPDDAESQFNIGVVYQQRGWLDAALVQYQDALRFAPDNTSIRYNLAILYNRKGQTRQAVEELERVVERDPTVAAAYIQLGVIYKRLGHPASAREMFLKALALDPKNAVANEGLASLE
ncbi:MAG: tetratricopeptide repeat protein, partial [candidate division Zixibacteria bacterium]|nr:tetratricopeptide repeat protein [candidate division Zixibacteria bacterium]